MYLQLAWKMSSSDSYKQRLENINSEEQQLRHTGTLADAKEQALTPFDYVTDDQLNTLCPSQPKKTSALADAAERQEGYASWLDAVHGFQDLNRAGTYRIVFFLNVAPLTCPDSDIFNDDTGVGLNALFTRVIGGDPGHAGMPVVSTHAALLHTRPSQMPGWSGHSFGNTNVVKADVLFSYLSSHVLPQ